MVVLRKRFWWNVTHYFSQEFFRRSAFFWSSYPFLVSHIVVLGCHHVRILLTFYLPSFFLTLLFSLYQEGSKPWVDAFYIFKNVYSVSSKMNVQKDGKCIARPPGGPAFSSSIRSYLSVKHLLTPRESMVQTFWDRIFYVPQRKQCFCQKVMTLARSFTPIFCSLFWRYCRRHSNLLQLLQRHSNVLQVNRLTFQCSFRKRGTKRKKWNFRSEEE